MKCPDCGKPLSPSTVGECPHCEGDSPGSRTSRGLLILETISNVGCLIMIALIVIGIVALTALWNRIFG